MKTKGTILLLAISGVVFMAYFLFSDFLSSDESSDGYSVELATGSTLPPLSSEGKVGPPKLKSFRRMDSSDEAIPESNLAPHGTEESEKWDQEQAETRELAPKQAEQDPQNEEAQEEDGGGKTLNEEQRASLEQFLGQLTRENWRQARTELLSAYQNGLLPRSRFVENQFWSKVGEVGGKELAMELLQNSDPAFSKVLEGWGKKNPQEVFDYFAELDIRSPQVQKYLEKTNSREYPFMDQLSNSLIEGLMHADSSGSLGDFQIDQISKAIDFFKENHPAKASSLMREFSKRVVKNKDPEVLKEWIDHYDDPRIQGEAAGKVIESGTFDKDPASAAEFAMSLKEAEARRPALSAAYARLAGGVNGHDPNLTANQLIEMDKGHDRDFALNGFAHGLVRKDPEGALEWAKEISNENFRKIVMKNISRRIKKERPKAQALEE
jgi:hypothetical protein